LITKKDLFGLAQFKGISPRLAELDYLQDIALINIFREFGNKIVFKGGTCLYKVYQLSRFSEDLDFNGNKGFKPKKLFDKLPYFFSLLGMKSRVRGKVFNTGANVYLDVNGPLYDGRKESVATIIFNVSTRERTLLGAQRHAYRSLYTEVRPFDLYIMHEQEILAEKIRAIYEREKARDVYDTWYLLNKKHVSFSKLLVEKKLSLIGTHFDKKIFLKKIDEKKQSWERDLGALVGEELISFNDAKKLILKKIGDF
jgi:predicted nucleotidyltransferase component of viral defense system